MLAAWELTSRTVSRVQKRIIPWRVVHSSCKYLLSTFFVPDTSKQYILSHLWVVGNNSISQTRSLKFGEMQGSRDMNDPRQSDYRAGTLVAVLCCLRKACAPCWTPTPASWILVSGHSAEWPNWRHTPASSLPLTALRRRGDGWWHSTSTGETPLFIPPPPFPFPPPTPCHNWKNWLILEQQNENEGNRKTELFTTKKLAQP